jgi:acetolactate synthase-1/2/3 large subunit
LVACGVRIAFCVPGESYLAVLDGLYECRDHLRLITTRQEGGAAMMAAAYGRLTGTPGVCLVTRGPGATNASIGVHIAAQDALPMILLVGQVPTEQLGRRAFQEIDYRSMFASVAKAVIEATTPDRLPEAIARAYHLSIAGEPGPVVVVLPEDVLATPTAAPVVPVAEPGGNHPSPQSVLRFQRELVEAERPIVIVGGTGWTDEARRSMRDVAEAAGIPVATAFRQQDLFDNASSAYAGSLGLYGTPGLEAAVAEADVVALLGTRPDAVTCRNFTLFDPQRQRLLHVHPDPGVINGIYPARLGIVSRPAEFVAALAAVTSRPAAGAPSAWLDRLRAAYLPIPDGNPRAAEYMAVLNALLPPDGIMTCGAGTYTEWLQRYRRYTAYPSQIGPQAGSMGYGLPAALAAKLVYPDREVVAFAGDGCLLMTGQELATAVQYRLGILVLVINNSSYGVIRNHQRARFPGRAIGTDLVNPDFARWARSFGAEGERVSSPEEFARAVGRPASAGVPRLIEIVATDPPEGIVPS